MAYLVNGAKQPIHNSRAYHCISGGNVPSATLESAACSSDLRS